MYTRKRQKTGSLARRWLVARMASLPVALLLASCGAGTVTTAPTPPAAGGLATGAPTSTAAVAPSPTANTVGSTATRAAVTSPTSPTRAVGTPATSVAPPGTPPIAATPPPLPDTGVIRGRVTDRDGGAPLPDTRILVGYKSTQLAAITDQDGRYTVRNVPAGEEVGVIGFYGHGYRYHNSIYDDNLRITLRPGQTFTYDFATYNLHDPAGEPQVNNPSIVPAAAAPGTKVRFSVTARGGKGGPSDEVVAVSPEIGRLVWLQSTGGDTYQADFTIPEGTRPGEYRFVFIAASNECYDNSTFPMLTLRVG